jgi:hypothetical protein
MMSYCSAIQELSHGLTTYNLLNIMRDIESAQRYLTEFRNQFVEAPTLTEAEVELSCNLHSYMRKCMDSDLGVMLYTMISESRGKPIWNSFVKGLVDGDMGFMEAIERAQITYQSDQITDNLLMLKSLRMWKDDFHLVVQWLG